METTTILMIDDDVALVRLTEINLTQTGYRFVSAAHGIEGLQLVRIEKPQLIILDITMPKLDGWETCRLLREITDIPIIILTARDSEADIARGLDLGADDYLKKPFSFVELQARIRAALRRMQSVQLPNDPARRGLFHVGDLTVDVDGHTVDRAGQKILLTPTEFRLLEYLLINAGIALTHYQLIEAGWGESYTEDTEILKPVISRLRQKIEEDPSKPKIITTIHGIGYRLGI